MTQDQCVFIRGFRIKDDKMQVIRALGVPEYDDPNIGVVDTIRPPVKNENPQRFSYRHSTLQRNDWGSSSSLDTIRPPNTHENPQLLPYPSSTTLQSNGSVSNASFMTSPSHDSFFEVRNYIVEIRSEDAFDEDTTNITHDNGLQLVESLTVNAEDRLPENNTSFNWNSYRQPFNLYREQLSSQYYGLALWNPNPVIGLFKDPDHVSIGDVGYLYNGAFMRIFNAKLPRDHPSNQSIELPVEYKPLKRERFDNVRRNEVRKELYRRHVSKVDNVRADTHDEDQGQTYECWADSHGALLYLPHGARSEDVIRTTLFEDYIRDNVDSWLRWSKKKGLPIKNMEDLILVTGCTLAKSWAAAVFDGTMSKDDNAATISLEARTSDGGKAQFVWRNICGSVEFHHNDSNIEGPENQCVFIRGFRAKRRFFWTKHLQAA
ncbi:hypothetical protein BGY98DRAFT_231093 [Russula aff. rugulosa BPL654]|nr:hypothetical protein BGY98DRAFT_231093 [Russula aff. rugulosa BPL654]